MKLRNLAKVEEAIANMFARVELAKANIYAFQVNRTRETESCTIIGLKEYHKGQGAILLLRLPSYWTVTLRETINLQKLGWTFDSSEGIGPIGDENNLYCVVVTSVAGLKRLSDLLDKAFGQEFDPADHGRLPVGQFDPKTRQVDSTDLCLPFDWFDPEWRRYEPSPGLVIKHSRTREQEIARLEITALRLLGSALGTVKDIEACLSEAANIAWVNIDRGSEEEKKLMASLASLLKDEVRAAELKLDNTPLDYSDRCQYAQNLEWLLVKRIYWLFELDRKKEAESLLNKVCMLRLELVQLYNDKRLSYMRPVHSKCDTSKAVLAFTCIRLARVIRRMKPNAESTEVKLLSAQAAQLRESIINGRDREMLDGWLSAEPALPYHMTGAGHKFGHYDW